MKTTIAVLSIYSHLFPFTFKRILFFLFLRKITIMYTKLTAKINLQKNLQTGRNIKKIIVHSTKLLDCDWRDIKLTVTVF